MSGPVPTWFDRLAAVAWRFLVVVAAAAVLLFVLARLSLVVIPVLVAVILTTVFVPVSRWLEDRGIPRGAASAIVVVGGVVLVTATSVLLITQFVAAAGELGQTLEQGRESLLDFLGREPLALDPGEVQDLLGRGAEQLRANVGVIAGGVLSGTMIVVQVLGGAVLVMILAFFFVRDGDDIVVWFLDLVPAEQVDTTRTVGRRVWSVLGRYVRGVVTIAAVDAVGIGLGLAIIGVPLAFPLALLVFFGGFIPLVGATVAGAVAVIVALANGGLTDALLTLAVVLLVQQVDGNILQPFVMGREVPLHPAVVLLAVAAGGILWGLAGAALAVPLAAVASAAGHELRTASSAG